MTKNDKFGTLYIVPTPIGNLGDMTIRAIEIMRSVDLLLTEDTRNTRKLLTHFDIKTRSRSYHSFSEKKDLHTVIDMLKDGRSIALISDAGMPGISDPGPILITRCHDEGIDVRVLPGPSAGITALVASGYKIGGHIFEGFLPQEEKSLSERIDYLSNFDGAVIIYEAPHRIKELMEKLAKAMSGRHVHIAREMTKMFEEHIRGEITEVSERVSKVEPRGEYAIILSPIQVDMKRVPPENKKILEFKSQCLSRGLSTKDAASLYASVSGMKRSEVYRIMNRDDNPDANTQ